MLDQEVAPLIDAYTSRKLKTTRNPRSQDEPPPCKKARIDQSSMNSLEHCTTPIENGHNAQTRTQDSHSPDPVISKHNPYHRADDKRTSSRTYAAKDTETSRSEEIVLTSPVSTRHVLGSRIEPSIDSRVQHATQRRRYDDPSNISASSRNSNSTNRYSKEDSELDLATKLSTNDSTARHPTETSKARASVLEYNAHDLDELQVHDDFGPSRARTAPRNISNQGDLHQQEFAPLSQRRPTTSTGKKKQFRSAYKLKSFCFNQIPNFPDAALWCDKQEKTLRIIHLDAQISADPIDGKLPISEITRMERTDTNDAAIVVFYCSKKMGRMNKFGFELESPKDLVCLIHEIHSLGDGIRQSAPKTHDKMLKVIESVQSELANSNCNAMSSVESAPKPLSSKSTRIIRSRSEIPERKRLDQQAVSIPTSKPVLVKEPAPAPTQAFTSLTKSSEATRSMRSNASALESVRAAPATKGLRCQGTPWDPPLVYPAGGKSPESMTWDDLSYLEDGQMLNETSIAVFLRYLRENIEPEQMKKIYFFSTFFYSSLTKAPPGGWPDKNCKINYNAVARWTKNINLFSRDYVVVPIHEASHFYVMIICNLPTLKTTSVSDDESDVDDIEDDAPDDTHMLDGTVIERGALSVDHPGLSHEVTPRKRGLKKRSAPVRRYDVKTPIIMTLDSLNILRSHTASILKQYIVKEAKDKHNLDITIGDIKGMTAARIPRQPNYCDCGLYTCMYIEQFMADPEKFKRTILQPIGFNPSEGIKWPPDAQIRSEDLRQALYEFLQALYRSYTQGTPAQVRRIGEILIRTDPGASEADKVEQVRQGIDAYRQYDANRQQRRIDAMKHHDVRDDTEGGDDSIVVVEESIIPRDESPEGVSDLASTIRPVDGHDTRSKYFVDDHDIFAGNTPIHVTPDPLGHGQGSRTPDKDSTVGAQSPRHNGTEDPVDLVSPSTVLEVRGSPSQNAAWSPSRATGHGSQESWEILEENKQVAEGRLGVKTVAEDGRPSQGVVEHGTDTQEQPWEGFSSESDEDMAESVEVPDSQAEAQAEVDLDDDMIMKD